MLFSSVAALLGGGGQTNYSAANSALDALAKLRRQHAQLASSVQWGPWGEVGMAADSSVNARLQASGWALITPAQGLAALQATLSPNVPEIVAMMVVAWTRMLAGGAPSLLSAMASQVATPAVAAAGRPGTAKGGAQRSCAVDVETVLALVQSQQPQSLLMITCGVITSCISRGCRPGGSGPSQGWSSGFAGALRKEQPASAALTADVGRASKAAETLLQCLKRDGVATGTSGYNDGGAGRAHYGMNYVDG